MGNAVRDFSALSSQEYKQAAEAIDPVQPMHLGKWQNEAELRPPFGSLAAPGSIVGSGGMTQSHEYPVTTLFSSCVPLAPPTPRVQDTLEPSLVHTGRASGTRIFPFDETLACAACSYHHASHW